MAKEWAKSFYNSRQWQRCRAAYISERKAIDGGMCEVCHNNLGYIVHHKVILTPENITNPNVSLSHDNLSYECKDCHDKEDEHFIKRSDDGERINVFDIDGNLIAVTPPLKG